MSTPKKIAGFYDVVLPGLAKRYQAYLDNTDRLLDEPSVRAIEGILAGFSRMRAESVALRDDLAKLRLNDEKWVAELKTHEAGPTNIVAHRPAASAA